MNPNYGSDFRSYLRFVSRVLAYLAGLLVAFSPVFGFYAYQLRSVGELVSSNYLAEMRNAEPILWLSGYYSSERWLKIPIAMKLKPTLVVLGSSRVMQLRAEMFAEKHRDEFYNLGAATLNISEVLDRLRTLVDHGTPPKLVILGLDWWWFMTTGDSAPTGKLASLMGPEWYSSFYYTTRSLLRYNDFVLDQVQLFQKAWRDELFYEALKLKGTVDPISGRKPLGVGAYLGAGFRNDGSYLYWNRILESEGRRTLDDFKTEGLENFQKENYRGNEVSQSSLNELARVIELCQVHNMDLIVLLPPMETSVLQVIRSDPASKDFWTNFPAKVAGTCRRTGVMLFDFSDASTLGTDYRYFIDWRHGSEVVYARILLAITSSEEGERLLRPYVDTADLQRDLMGAPTTLRLYNR